MERKKEYYPDVPLCEEGCTFIRYNKDTEKVTCKCDYKINSENYTNITFIKNTKDEKFLKDLVMENMQSMKCFKVIFKWINLKSNAGFFIMIIFLVIFFGACVLYYTTGGFRFLNKFVKKSISDKGINDILKSSINSDNSNNNNNKNDKNVNKHIKFQGDDNDPDNKDKNKDKGPKRKKGGGNNDDSFRKKPGYDTDSMKSDVLLNDPNKGKNKPPNNNDDDGSDNEDDKYKNKKKGPKRKKGGGNNDDSFNKNKPGYDTDSMNSSVLKNDPNKGKNKPRNNNNDDDNKDDNGNKGDNSDNSDKIDNTDDKDDKDKKKGPKKKKKVEFIDDSFKKGKPGYDTDSMNSSVLKNDPNKPRKNNDDSDKDNDEDDKDDKGKKKGPKKKKKIEYTDVSFKKGKPGYDSDSMNSSVLKNDPNKPSNNKKDSNDEDSNNPNPNDNSQNVNNEEPKDDNNPKKEEDNKEEENEDQKDPNKKGINKNKKKKKRSDKISEGDIPGNNYDKDSNYSCLKNDEKNNPKNNIEDNEEDKENKENKENIEIKKKKKKKLKKDKTLISDGQKQEDYSNDSMVSGAAALKQKLPDSSQDKSLISEKSKEKKNDDFNNENDEEEINVGDISNIKGQLFGDESKNDEDIIKEMGDKDNKNEDNIDINLNINDTISNRGDDKNKNNNNNNNKDADIINIKDIQDNDSLDLSKENEKIPEKKEEKKEEKKKKTESSFISKYSQVKKAKEEGFYDKDSDILRDDDSHISKNYDINDLISEKSEKPNPPKKGEIKINEQILDLKESQENNKINRVFQLGSNYGIYSSKGNIKSSGEDINNKQISQENKNDESIKEEIEDKKDKKVSVNKILKTNDEIVPLDDFSEKYKTFMSIYLADLKKHHILYFSFSYSKDDINNIFLKLSLFSISIVLYFSLNTIFMINSKMANAYLDMKNSSLIYILINLILPYIICGIIILFLKTYIMPISYVTKIIKTIQKDNNLKNSLGLKKLEEEIAKKDIPKQQKKRIIKNHKSSVNNLDMKAQNEYKEEKDKIEKKVLPLYLKHRKIVIIYFILGFIFLGINWYMMTSFCAIYKNTGVKLIVNSFVSLFASFVFPCIFGLIPSLVGYLAKKLKSKIIFNIYKIINKVL